MSDDYVANCPISMPINIPGVRPDVDFGGLMFSYEWGPIYLTTMEDITLREPEN